MESLPRIASYLLFCKYSFSAVPDQYKDVKIPETDQIILTK